MTQSREQHVYVTNWQNQDLTHAKTFGALKIISKGRIESFKMDILCATALDALKDSRPDDWLITTGHMVLGIIAAVEFIRRHNRLNLLIWHAVHHRYIPRILHLDIGAGLDEPSLKEILVSDVPVEL